MLDPEDEALPRGGSQFVVGSAITFMSTKDYTQPGIGSGVNIVGSHVEKLSQDLETQLREVAASKLTDESTLRHLQEMKSEWTNAEIYSQQYAALQRQDAQPFAKLLTVLSNVKAAPLGVCSCSLYHFYGKCSHYSIAMTEKDEAEVSDTKASLQVEKTLLQKDVRNWRERAGLERYRSTSGMKSLSLVDKDGNSLPSSPSASRMRSTSSPILKSPLRNSVKGEYPQVSNSISFAENEPYNNFYSRFLGQRINMESSHQILAENEREDAALMNIVMRKFERVKRHLEESKPQLISGKHA